MAFMDSEWFEGSIDYWKKVDCSITGVLGGYGELHSRDIQDSKKFLCSILPSLETQERVLDVGSGIGRVSNCLLSNYFNRLSILESDERFVAKAKTAIGAKMEHIYNCRLQQFSFVEDRYFDVIWIQWVLLYATDEELLWFFLECQKSLRPSGIIIVKENVLAGDRNPEFDTTDHSIIRSLDHLKRIFKESGLVLVSEVQQTGFPPNLYPVWMFALKPK